MAMQHSLADLRLACGLTQAELARRAGLSIRTIQRYERGEVSGHVLWSRVRAVARALGLPPSDVSDTFERER